MKRLYYVLPEINCNLGDGKLKEVNFQPGEMKLLIGPREYGHIKPIHFPVEHQISLNYDNYVIEDYRALTDYDICQKFLKDVNNLNKWKDALENIITNEITKEFMLCDVKFTLATLYTDNESYLFEEAIKLLTTRFI